VKTRLYAVMLISILLTLFTTGCTTVQTEVASNERIIELEFVPETVVVMETGEPETGWERVRSVSLSGLGSNGVLVHLYMNTEETYMSPNEVWGAVEVQGLMYNLGIIGSYGIDDVALEIKDVTGDGRSELLITATAGASYRERRIIGYDQENNSLVMLLTMGTPWEGDLDGDGREDIVAVSAGSIPQYVWIYRFAQGRFERSDVTLATGNLYAFIDGRDGMFWIESGKPNEPQYFRYESGTLIQLQGPPGK